MGHVKDRWLNKAKEPTARYGTGLRWQVWYRVDGREKCGGSFKKKAAAERELVKLESSVIRGQWVDPTDQTTVSELARRVAGTRPHGPRTARRINGMIRNHLDGTALGGQRISAVRRGDAQAWVTERARLLAPTTVRQMVKFVSGVFTAAVADRLISSSPFIKLSLPRADQERGRASHGRAGGVPGRHGEAEVPRDGAGPGRPRAAPGRAAGAARRGRRLPAPNRARRAPIDQKTRERIPPKTPKSRRALPLPDMVSLALAEHLRTVPPTEDGLIFHTSTGMPFWHEFYTQKVFAPAVRKAGLPPGTTTHALRHHYASVLLLAGESVVAVAERLGHDNATLVLTTYGHLIPGSDERTRKAVDSAWNAVSEPSGESATARGRPQ